MANSSIRSDNKEVGVIILGNSGAGKSFICNLLLGEEKCTADFQSQAVTTTTTVHRVIDDSFDLLIYDIPGLLESNQHNIDRNIVEIKKVFENCPETYVIFVWAHIGGRVQNDDIIAFNALNEAYQFPPECLMFVLNNIPVKRPPEFDAKFIVTLSHLLPNMEISSEKLMFLPTLDLTDKESVEDNRLKLFAFLLSYRPSLQKQHNQLTLAYKQIKIWKDALEQQLKKAEMDKQILLCQIAEMKKQHEAAIEKADAQYKKILSELQHVKKNVAQNEEYFGYFKKAGMGAAAGAASGAAFSPIGSMIGATIGALGGFGLGKFLTIFRTPVKPENSDEAIPFEPENSDEDIPFEPENSHEAISVEKKPIYRHDI